MTEDKYEPVEWADVKVGDIVRATLPHTIIEGEVAAVEPDFYVTFPYGNAAYRGDGWTLERRVEPITLPTGLGAVIEVEWKDGAIRYVQSDATWRTIYGTRAGYLPKYIREHRPKVTVLSEGYTGE